MYIPLLALSNYPSHFSLQFDMISTVAQSSDCSLLSGNLPAPMIDEFHVCVSALLTGNETH